MIYEPAEDSHLLARALRPYVLKKRVLDMGAGSGILAQTALNAGACDVVVVDIDEAVVRSLKKRGFRAVHSDLFAAIRESFEVIVCNPPYLPNDVCEDEESKRITAGGKQGDEITLRFLRAAPKHLVEEGIILLLLSSLTPQGRITALLKKQKMTHREIASRKLWMETLVVWEITARVKIAYKL